MNDPAGDVLVELGSSDYLKRYKIYISHVQEWRQQFQKLESVNLRYDNQVIVNPDMEGKPKQAALSASAARAAAAAGVKPAALITKINPHDKSIPKPAFELSERKLDPKPTAKKPPAKWKPRTVTAKSAKAAPRKEPVKHPALTKATAPHAVKAKTSAAHPARPRSAKKPSSAMAAIASSPKPSPGVVKQ